MPQKVALYIRVSTQEQAQEGYSIDAQTDRLISYCKARDWPVADVYTDPGFSGSNMNRPALQHLFDDIKAGHIDCVLVYKLDRLSRSQKDTLYMIEDVFIANSISFVSMQENFDTSSPFGRAMIGILSVFAQLEREQIKERMNMGKEERAKAGRWHGGGRFHPTGYHYENGELHLDALGVEIVRDIFSLFLEHTPLHRIQTIIWERYHHEIGHTRIKYILENPLYLGKITWSGNVYEGKHEPIISVDTFRKAQSLLEDRYRLAISKPLPFRPKYLLVGLLVCGNCGANYMTRGTRGPGGVPKIYYSCYSRAKCTRSKIIDPNCKNPNYDLIDLDARIIAEVAKVAKSESYLKSVSQSQTKKTTSLAEKKRIAIMQRLDAIDSQISRILDLYQVGTIGIDEIGQRTRKLQDEKATLQNTLKKLEAPKQDMLSLQEARSALDRFMDIISSDDLAAKRQILHTLIKKIIAKPKVGEIEIIWNF